MRIQGFDPQHFTDKGTGAVREKRAYRNERSARAALEAFGGRGDVYQCGYCGAWHLTSRSDPRSTPASLSLYPERRRSVRAEGIPSSAPRVVSATGALTTHQEVTDEQHAA